MSSSPLLHSDASNLQRQDYIDVPYPPDKSTKGFNPEFFQPKYDGIWAKVVWDGSSPAATIYSRTNQIKGTILVPNSVKRLGAFVLLGEYLVAQQRAVGSKDYGKIVFFDCLYVSDCPAVQYATYRDRYIMLRNLIDSQRSETSPWMLVPSLHLQHLAEVWQLKVQTGEFEGVVYRRWDTTYDKPLWRSKLAVTLDVIIVGFVEGDGKYTGTLGALRCNYYNGTPETEFTCSGMDDAFRHSVWAAKSDYLNHPCEVVARGGVFSSGKPRHPQFVQLRPDKLPTQCTRQST